MEGSSVSEERYNLARGAHSSLGVILAALTLACLSVHVWLVRCIRDPAIDRETYSGGLELSTLKNLDHDGIFVGGTEFILESGLAGSVKDTLSTVAMRC